ncbi:MBL fold metallo-hydrolase [Bacteroidales bacterium OttesenSCG-928-C19]|nr:MBL fold metallo-hydrolase [Bacteroidales bacterium OttesenSCG-928-C19]
MSDIEVTFLGTGTSQGVPIIACDCEVCKSKNAKDKRLRSSVLVKTQGKDILIDVGPDFRQQALRENITRLDAVLLTHAHRDHTAGIDEIRSLNYAQKAPMDVYASQETIDVLVQNNAYIFSDSPYPGAPQINLIQITADKSFSIDNVEILPIDILHWNLHITGYRIGNFTYITDASAISDKAIENIKGTELLVLNALRKEKHISHFSLSEALEIIEKIKPKRAYLTHIGHLMGFHDEVSKELPENVFLAYDGLKIEL